MGHAGLDVGVCEAVKLEEAVVEADELKLVEPVEVIVEEKDAPADGVIDTDIVLLAVDEEDGVMELVGVEDGVGGV